jgi:Trk K+ transport system NAD-binding subunit
VAAGGAEIVKFLFTPCTIGERSLNSPAHEVDLLRVVVRKGGAVSKQQADPGAWPESPGLTLEDRREVRRKPSVRARLRYRFDNLFARGPSAVIGVLAVASAVVIVITASLVALLHVTGLSGGGRLNFIDALWRSMVRVTGKGDASDSGWPSRILSFAVALASLFITGALFGLLTSSVNQRIARLRAGRSAVVEHDHTLILGWTDRVPVIVSEIVIANESRKRAAIVVLGETEKAKMEDTLRDKIRDFRTTRLVCRNGSPSVPADLGRVNCVGARSIVVIGGDDARTVKVLLAIRAAFRGGRASHVVAEIDDPAIGRSVRSLFGEQVVIVSSGTVTAELTAQACRQPGLGQVFDELLDFDGDEVYMAPFPQLVGRTFAEAQQGFAKAAVMGLLSADGDVQLNPPATTVIEDGDQVIAIAEDDSLFTFTGVRRVDSSSRQYATEDVPAIRRTIVVGWSKLGVRVIEELDRFASPYSTLEVLVDPDRVDIEVVRAGIKTTNLTVELATPGSRPEDIVAHAAREHFDEVIVLGHRGGDSKETADVETLMTLLAFNQAVREYGFGPVRLIAELLEQRHAPLAEATGVDDFIVSDALTSLMIAQVAERRELGAVFRTLFDPEGATIELAPVDRYGATECHSFAEVVAAASVLGHTALGYRRGLDGIVTLNPNKNEPLVLRRSDEVVVLC